MGWQASDRREKNSKDSDGGEHGLQRKEAFFIVTCWGARRGEAR